MLLLALLFNDFFLVALLQRFQMLALALLPNSHNSSRSAEITDISNQMSEVRVLTTILVVYSHHVQYLVAHPRSGVPINLEKCHFNPVSLLVELQAICEVQIPDMVGSYNLSSSKCTELDLIRHPQSLHE